MITIFQVITMEGWVDIMNMIDDTNDNVFTPIYFCMIIIIGSFFLLNLILAVIMRVFTQNDEVERGKLRKKKIIEDTRKLRLDPKHLLQPLKTEKIERPKSASHRKRFSILDLEEPEAVGQQTGLPDLNKFSNMLLPNLQGNLSHALSTMRGTKTFIDKSKVSNNLEIAKKDDDADSVRSSPRKQVIEEPSPQSIRPELSRLSSQQNLIDVSNKLISIKNHESTKTLGFGSPRSRAHNKRAASHVSSTREDKDKLFAKILKMKSMTSSMKSSISSSEPSEFKGGENDNSNPSSPKREKEVVQEPEKVVEGWRGAISALFLKITMSNYFSLFIMGSIVINTAILCMERYPMSNEEQRWQEYSNLLFSAIFFIEMVIKLIGHGIKGYLRDRFNMFDWFVVLVSIADIVVSFTFEFDVEAGGAISAFRIFRLFRVLKLVKAWKKFQKLIGTIINSIKDVSNFSVLLFLFIFIYTLLGRELFAYNITFDENGNFSKSDDATSPRNNFDSFFDAIITIFIVLTGEQWASIMYDSYRYNEYLALLFFISLVMIGQMILLNLFLAILIENFNIDNEDSKKEKKEKSPG